MAVSSREGTAVASAVEQAELSGVGFEQAVFVLDVTIAATAFCHLSLHGRLDADAKAIVAVALQRRLHPAVLEELGAEPNGERTAAVFAAAPEGPRSGPFRGG